VATKLDFFDGTARIPMSAKRKDLMAEGEGVDPPNCGPSVKAICLVRGGASPTLFVNQVIDPSRPSKLLYPAAVTRDLSQTDRIQSLTHVDGSIMIVVIVGVYRE
jgi:hypothetical protein